MRIGGGGIGSKRALKIGLCAVLLAAGVTRGQEPATKPPSPPATAPPPQAGRGGRRLDAEIKMGADFSPKPPVTRLDPAEQQKHFLLPPGFKIEPVLTDPLIEDPVGVTFDGNGRMYVLEMRSYMRDADGSELPRADQPHLAPRGHQRRRHLRQAHRVRRQAGAAAHRLSAAGRRPPRARDRQPRPRTSTPTRTATASPTRRRSFYTGVRPRHQHGVAARRHDLGARQLALHDLQPVPAAHHARTARSCARRRKRQRRPVVGGAGQLRQDLVRGRRRRDRPGQLPGADRLRRVQRRPTTSSRTSRCRGRRPAASPTCRAA